MTELETNDWRRRAAQVIAMTALTVVSVVSIAAALIYASDIFLILFLAVLFSVFLTRVSRLVGKYVPISYGWSLGAVTAVLVLVLFGGVALLGAKIDSQVAEAGKHLESSKEQLQKFAERHPTLKSILSSTPVLQELVKSDSSATGESEASAQQQKDSQALPKAATGALKSVAKPAVSAVGAIFKTTFGLLVNSLLIFFVGLFIAVAPGNYRDGFVVLFPPRRRDRAREILNDMGEALWNWLLGRFGSMLVTGIGAGLLLLMLGVPMAISLGVIAGLLTFIPNIGAVIAVMLAMLFALPQGGSTVAAVLIGYLVLQLVESYVVTPLIQQRQASLPPALLISFQAAMGVVFGFLGAMVASPILAAGKVLVEQAYIRDLLEHGGTDEPSSDASDEKSRCDH